MSYVTRGYPDADMRLKHYISGGDYVVVLSFADLPFIILLLFCSSCSCISSVIVC